jgi:hypothetical protein
MESVKIRNLKPECWGSPLVQEAKHREKPLKREEEEIIIIITIIEFKIVLLDFIHRINYTIIKLQRFETGLCFLHQIKNGNDRKPIFWAPWIS